MNPHSLNIVVLLSQKPQAGRAHRYVRIVRFLAPGLIAVAQFLAAYQPVRAEPAPTVECPTLGATWTAGTADRRSDGTGYDVSTCVRGEMPLPKAEMVKPAERDPERWAAARCNDGTPFAIEVQLSPISLTQEREIHDWVIFLKGGGFCDDNAISCQGRPPSLRSTPPAGDRTIVDFPKSAGIFNRDSGRNSTFHEANFVHAYYCSSDMWSGATAERRETVADPAGWYFSGRLNVAAMIEALQERYGLDDGNPRPACCSWASRPEGWASR